jgi:outer membrane immunogenic protein
MLRMTIASLALMALSFAAEAAEPITVPLDSTGSSVPLSEGAMDWSGFYAGVYGAIGQGESRQAGLGLAAGVNAQIGFVLVGAEVSLQGMTDEAVDTAYGAVVGRAGLLLDDDILLYAAAGYGWDLAGGEAGLLAGGGLEFAVNDQLSLNAQYLRGFDQDGEATRDQLTLGARFHF